MKTDIARWDKQGNYLQTAQDKANIETKKKGRAFVEKMAIFLKTHNINGIAYTYGFASTHKKNTSEKLRKLGVQFRVDNSPNFHTKFIINKNGI